MGQPLTLNDEMIERIKQRARSPIQDDIIEYILQHTDKREYFVVRYASSHTYKMRYVNGDFEMIGYSYGYPAVCEFHGI